MIFGPEGLILYLIRLVKKYFPFQAARTYESESILNAYRKLSE
jgi:hypothetical protein